jgi:hypothetical protein
MHGMENINERNSTAASGVQASDLHSFHFCMPLLERLRSERSITRRRSVKSRRKQKGLTFVATNFVVSSGSLGCWRNLKCNPSVSGSRFSVAMSVTVRMI